MHLSCRFVLVITLFIAGTLSVNAAGFRLITQDDVQIGVWYPSDAATTSQRLGPFEVDVARGAPISAGSYQVVLFSHGNGGRYRNHYLTAQVLADAGFLVAAPQHRADHLIGGSKTAAALNHRYLELATALRAVSTHPDLSARIDRSVVHGLGYSLGGATILLAAGAEYSTERVDRYCSANAKTDAEFCEAPGWLYRTMQSLRHNISLPETAVPFSTKALINGKMVLVAPIFQGLALKAALPATSLNIFAIAGDEIAKPEFHAQPLSDAASAYLPTELESISGHHFAFIAPFPKWLTDEEDIPVAMDPEGFDRQSFLADLNSRILAVFLSE